VITGLRASRGGADVQKLERTCSAVSPGSRSQGAIDRGRPTVRKCISSFQDGIAAVPGIVRL